MSTATLTASADAFAPIHVPDLSTRAIHAGLHPDPTHGSLLTPIVQSTTFVQDGVGRDRGFTYSRAGNPTVAALEVALGELEDAPPAVCFGTGMAATTALLLATLKAGDHVVVSDVVYGGTVRLLRNVLANFGVDASFVDTATPAAVDSAITKATRLIFIETPANPTLKLTDIAAIAEIATRQRVPLVVDNTFLTPALQQPLDLGASVSLYSTTKYIEGHNATLGGAIVSRDRQLIDHIRFIRKTLGSTQSPFEAWLTLRGIKTLPLRIKQHSANAMEIARWLEDDGRISRVYYPGLETFAQRDLARRQQADTGGIIAFEVVGGAATARCVLQSLALCTLAENLGAVETLVTHPATMTHGDVPVEQRHATGVTDGLIRLSVGLECPADIIADIDAALTVALGGRQQ